MWQKSKANRPGIGEEDGVIGGAGGAGLAEEHLRLHVHQVRRDELGVAEEHGDPEEQHDLDLPAAIVAHHLGRGKGGEQGLALELSHLLEHVLVDKILGSLSWRVEGWRAKFLSTVLHRGQSSTETNVSRFLFLLSNCISLNRGKSIYRFWKLHFIQDHFYDINATKDYRIPCYTNHQIHPND